MWSKSVAVVLSHTHFSVIFPASCCCSCRWCCCRICFTAFVNLLILYCFLPHSLASIVSPRPHIYCIHFVSMSPYTYDAFPFSICVCICVWEQGKDQPYYHYRVITTIDSLPLPHCLCTISVDKTWEKEIYEYYLSSSVKNCVPIFCWCCCCSMFMLLPVLRESFQLTRQKNKKQILPHELKAFNKNKINK